MTWGALDNLLWMSWQKGPTSTIILVLVLILLPLNLSKVVVTVVVVVVVLLPVVVVVMVAVMVMVAVVVVVVVRIVVVVVVAVVASVVAYMHYPNLSKTKQFDLFQEICFWSSVSEFLGVYSVDFWDEKEHSRHSAHTGLLSAGWSGKSYCHWKHTMKDRN